MPETLGHYKILERLGADEAGELYRARDTRLGRTVAIRVVGDAITHDPERLHQFLADAHRAAAVSHPNIAAFYEIAEDRGTHYLACEYVTGQKLQSLIAGRPLNPRRAVDLTIQIADALAEASAGDLAHGDVRTDTIIVTAKGNAKLLDFGLAGWTSGGRGPVTGDQTDLVALGGVLYEMLTGTPAAAHGASGRIDARLPRELDAIVRKALGENPGEQYESAATLAADLRSVLAALDDRTAVRGPSPAWPKRARRQAAFVWLIVLALLGGIGWLVWMGAAAK